MNGLLAVARRLERERLRRLAFIQAIERRGEFSFAEPELTQRDLDALDQQVEVCRRRIAVALGDPQ